MRRRRVKQGDTTRRRWVLKNAGKAIDLTDAASVEMRAVLAPGQAAPGTTTLVGAMEFVVPRMDGIVLEPVGGTGTLDAALYRVGFWIAWGDGSVDKVPDEDYQLLEVLAAP